jgi:hypothetical protein
MGQERGVVDACWEVALIAREQEDVVEIEVTSFEDSHNLYAFDGFTVEGDCGGLDYLVEEFCVEGNGKGDIFFCDECPEPVEKGEHAEERLGKEGEILVLIALISLIILDIQCDGLGKPKETVGKGKGIFLVGEGKEELAQGVVRGYFFGCEIVYKVVIDFLVQLLDARGYVLGEGMTQYGINIVKGVAVPLEQDSYYLYERGDRCLREGEACGDVEADTCWQTMENGGEQTFVGKDDGCASACIDALRGEPLTDIACLQVIGGGGND